MFPELVAHPAVLTNMRGLYSDVIADHVFGYVLCFARNFHIYIRNQRDARWAPVGGKAETGIWHAARGVRQTLDGVLGRAEPSGFAFRMRVLALDPVQTAPPPGRRGPLARQPAAGAPR